jgi:hypothetical protein
MQRAKIGAKVQQFFELCKFIAYNRAIYLRNRLQLYEQPTQKGLTIPLSNNKNRIN